MSKNESPTNRGPSDVRNAPSGKLGSDTRIGAPVTAPASPPLVKLRVCTTNGIPNRRRGGEAFTSSPKDVSVTKENADLILADTSGLVAYRIPDGGGDFGGDVADENATLRAENDGLRSMVAELEGKLAARTFAPPHKG